VRAGLRSTVAGAALTAAILMAGRVEAMECHVAPQGSDTAAGTAAEPKATLAAALAASRAAAPGEERRIVVAGGEYCMGGPLRLDARDSGLVMEAAPGAEPILYGGRPLTGWEPDGERFWSAPLPEGEFLPDGPRLLVVNGRFCDRARLPETGRFQHLTKFDVRWMGTNGGGWQRKPTEEELTTMRFRPEDLPAGLDARNAEFTVYHMWDESLAGVARIDWQTHTVTFATPLGHPPGGFGVQDYVVWNVREGMHRPGQWYLDRTRRRVVYWPLADEDMTSSQALVPAMESILTISGSEQEPARDVIIRGLTFSVTDTPLQAGGFGAGRYRGAIDMGNTGGCRLERLTIVNVGGQGIRTWRADGLRVERCHVHHTGACGMMIRGTGAVTADNHVHDVGVSYPSAIGISGGGEDCVIEHNEVHDIPYSAIICGGVRNRIEANLIYRAMRELHDGAGIYCGGGKELVLRGNFIRDIADTGGYGASAYYLDEMCEGCIVERNLSLRVVRPSHNHWAQRNTIRDNVFVSDGDMEVTFPRCEGYRFERNVLYAAGTITFRNLEAVDAMPANCIFSAAGKVRVRTLDDYREVGTGDLEPPDGTILADPQLRPDLLEEGRAGYGAGSPVRGLGVEPLDVSTAGRRP
jgi:hypothetical protein